MRFHSAILSSVLLATPPLAASENTAAEPSLHEAFRGQPWIGVAVPPLDMLNKEEIRLVTKHFNAVTPENCMKPAFLQPQEGRFDFKVADDLVRDARRRNLLVNGHTLIRHSQTPDWFFNDNGKPAGRELLLTRMRAHIQGVAGRFAGKIQSWDVVNEVIDDGGGYLRPSPWLAGIGPDYIAVAFIAAH